MSEIDTLKKGIEIGRRAHLKNKGRIGNLEKKLSSLEEEITKLNDEKADIAQLKEDVDNLRRGLDNLWFEFKKAR